MPTGARGTICWGRIAGKTSLSSPGVVGEARDAGEGNSEGGPEGDARDVDGDNNIWKLLDGDDMFTSGMTSCMLS